MKPGMRNDGGADFQFLFQQQKLGRCDDFSFQQTTKKPAALLLDPDRRARQRHRGQGQFPPVGTKPWPCHARHGVPRGVVLGGVGGGGGWEFTQRGPHRDGRQPRLIDNGDPPHVHRRPFRGTFTGHDVVVAHERGQTTNFTLAHERTAWNVQGGAAQRRRRGLVRRP